MKYQYMYFLKDEQNNNIPILTGRSQKLHEIVFPTNSLKKKIHTDFQESIGNLYVWIDGTVFKVAP